jgi:endoglucanase
MNFRDDLLHEILSQPSAPFREAHVIDAITHALKQGGVPHFQDPIGNIVVGAESKADYLKLVRARDPEPVRIFIAHMDHPGFHGVKWLSPERLAIHWHGGSPTQHLDGAAVWLADRGGWAGEGHLSNVEMHAHGRAIKTATVEIPSLYPRKAESLYGGFRFRAPHWREGRVIYTKAADDLVGSFAIVSLALDLFAKGSKMGKKPPFLGLLTRAEEVGFIGAIGHFEQGWLAQAKRDILCVSLETSRTLPGAEIGKGPVVRLGDKYTVFDSGRLRVFTELAAKVLPNTHQRRVMDGGTCEGTTATVYGYPTVGISVPLGNYHNQSFEGGPDSAGPNGPAPEFVHLDDVDGLLKLCHGLLEPKLKWAQPWAAKRAEFRKDLRGYRAHLKAGP